MDLPDFELDTSLLGNANVPNPTVYYDIVIVGGGPAAMSAAVNAARKMVSGSEFPFLVVRYNVNGVPYDIASRS